MNLFIVTLFFLCTTVISLFADGTLTGYVRLPKVKDNPSQGWKEAYEHYVFVFGEGESIGQSARAGAPPGKPISHDGFYEFTLPAGKYSVWANEPRFFPRAKVMHDIIVRDGQTTNLDIILNTDYSCFIDKFGGVGDNVFYQTFIASSSYINRIALKVAGGWDQNKADISPVPLTLTIHAGGIDGQQVGPSRSVNAKPSSDTSFSFPSGELPLVPGQMYAIKFQTTAGYTWAPYHATEDIYPNGQGYVGNSPYNSDWQIYIGGDSDDTTVSYIFTKFTIGRLETGWNVIWGQTFKARSTAIAGVDYFPTVGSGGYFITSYVLIRENGPTGRIVAPKKTVLNPSDYVHGASWGPTESTLIPGNIYFVELGCVSTTHPEFGTNPGMNMWLREGDDGYNDGTAYLGTEQKPDWDINLTILEYTSAASQNIGTIQGTITETGTSNTIAGANIDIKQGGVTKYTLTSASNGTYTLPVDIGTYDLTVSQLGYVPETKTGNVITKNQTTTVNFNLAKQVTTSDTTPPPVPTLSSPVDGSTQNIGIPTFDWTDVTDVNNQTPPVRYELLVDNDSSFSTPEINQPNLTVSQFTPATVMSNGTYYWRVRAKDSVTPTANVSAPTSAWFFTLTLDNIPPSSVGDLSAQPGSAVGDVNLQWSSPGDDGNTGTLTGTFSVQYLTTNGPWDRNLAQVTVPAVNVIPGTLTTYKFTNLSPGGKYYFCIWIGDDSNNWSGVSNVTSAIAQQTVRKLGTPETKFITGKIPAKFANDIQEVKIYDAKGKLIAELKQSEFTGGQIVWYPKDKSGNNLESGVYIYRSKTVTNKMVYGTITVAK